MGEKSVHIVCYEDLTNDPEKVMRGVCRYLGVSYHPCMSKPTIFGESVVVNSSSKVTTEVFKSEISWRSELTTREVLCVMLSRAILRARNMFVSKTDRIDFSSYQGIVESVRERDGA